jgi:hypothetical protein
MILSKSFFRRCPDSKDYNLDDEGKEIVEWSLYYDGDDDSVIIDEQISPSKGF